MSGRLEDAAPLVIPDHGEQEWEYTQQWRPSTMVWLEGFNVTGNVYFRSAAIGITSIPDYTTQERPFRADALARFLPRVVHPAQYVTIKVCGWGSAKWAPWSKWHNVLGHAHVVERPRRR